MKDRVRLKNVLITGNPGVGKTTLIKDVISRLNISAGGFYTSEMRDEQGRRSGFKIISLDGREEIMASVDIVSRYRISRYAVDIEAIDRIGVKAILDALNNNVVSARLTGEGNDLIVIDEIGRMELFSRQFTDPVMNALDSEKIVLGTISVKNTNFTKKIKERLDTRTIKLSRENYSETATHIERLIGSI